MHHINTIKHYKMEIHLLTSGNRCVLFCLFVCLLACFFPLWLLLLLWAKNFTERDDDKYTLRSWSYYPHKSCSPFNYTEDACNPHKWIHFSFVTWRQMSFHFNFFTLRSIGLICKGNLIILHYLEILHFRVSHLFSFIWFSFPVELVRVISFAINSLDWL
jgi:hypothetical protein